MTTEKHIISEFLKFDVTMIDLGDPVSDDRFEQFESQIGYKLPADFKNLVKKYNYIALYGTIINGLGAEFDDSSLDKLYHFEHSEVSNPMPAEIFPFSPDGAGNHYCFDLSADNDKVLFWQHDLEYADKTEIEVCNGSFYDWIMEVMIGWTLEDLNYDGTEK